MYEQVKHRQSISRLVTVIIILSTLAGCVYLRLLEFRSQLAAFDEYFLTEVNDDFTLIFKEPVLYRDDFDYLSKLQPSEVEDFAPGKRTHYIFNKINSKGQFSSPPVELRMTLLFNEQDLLTHWTHSPEFLAMVPPEFLTVSLRSLGSSIINRSKRQIKGDLTKVGSIDTRLPNRADIEGVLGDPLQVLKRQSHLRSVYRFRLKTENIAEGYEDRSITVIKLDFDPDTLVLAKMAGRFVGVKISVDYQKLTDQPP